MPSTGSNTVELPFRAVSFALKLGMVISVFAKLIVTIILSFLGIIGLPVIISVLIIYYSFKLVFKNKPDVPAVK